MRQMDVRLNGLADPGSPLGRLLNCMTRALCHVGVAAVHSHNLTFSRAVTQHVMDAVDVIVGSPRALPMALEAMLFQQKAAGTLRSTAGGGLPCYHAAEAPLWFPK